MVAGALGAPLLVRLLAVKVSATKLVLVITQLLQAEELLVPVQPLLLAQPRRLVLVQSMVPAQQLTTTVMPARVPIILQMVYPSGHGLAMVPAMAPTPQIVRNLLEEALLTTVALPMAGHLPLSQLQTYAHLVLLSVLDQ
jgi:hypothetical protein